MIVVVGSLNHDTTAFVPRLPSPGETVLGTRHFTDSGGKGANQAVAIARLGGQVSLVGRVGDDAAGAGLLASLDASGVLRESVNSDASLPTGAAFITVDDQGENMIVVSPGANSALTPADLDGVGLESASVVLVQLEVPMAVVAAAAARTAGTFILNPAPAVEIPQEVMDRVDVLVPNRSELALLAGTTEPKTRPELIDAVSRLGVRTVVTTLGRDGALIVEGAATTDVPAPVVDAVDPTAAGDAFCGAMALMIAEGEPLVSAVEFAVRAGAFAASRQGAQASLPSRDEL